MDGKLIVAYIFNGKWSYLSMTVGLIIFQWMAVDFFGWIWYRVDEEYEKFHNAKEAGNKETSNKFEEYHPRSKGLFKFLLFSMLIQPAKYANDINIHYKQRHSIAYFKILRLGSGFCPTWSKLNSS